MNPDPFVRGTDPRIRIRTKMSRIPNTGCNVDVILVFPMWLCMVWGCGLGDGDVAALIVIWLQN
jgi:hypothetical protein